jgi:hypothetical protein
MGVNSFPVIFHRSGRRRIRKRLRSINKKKESENSVNIGSGQTENEFEGFDDYNPSYIETTDNCSDNEEDFDKVFQ